MNYVYFDNAATTPVDPKVVEAMLPYFSDQYGNPSSVHGPGRMARLGVESARKKIAAIMGCKPQSIVFTSGGTEAANTALRSAISTKGLYNIITSRTEHACVLETARSLHQKALASLNYVRLDDHGGVQLTDLSGLLETAHGPSLVCLMHANNETGTSLNLSLAAEICKRNKAVFFSDTVQTVGHYMFDLSRNSPDMISASAHKFHGPKGTGFLYVREGLPFHPIITGGSHESARRAGTENVAGIVGMAKALELAAERYFSDAIHIRLLKHMVREKLFSLGAVINGGDNENALYTVLSARFPKNEATQNLLMELDMAGIAVSGGSACSAGKGGSHVMEAIGASDGVNIRFSFSRFNTTGEVNKLIHVLEDLLQEKAIDK